MLEHSAPPFHRNAPSALKQQQQNAWSALQGNYEQSRWEKAGEDTTNPQSLKARRKSQGPTDRDLEGNGTRAGPLPESLDNVHPLMEEEWTQTGSPWDLG